MSYNRTARHCEHCGAQLQVDTFAPGPARRYCDGACRTAAYRARVKRGHRPRSSTQRKRDKEEAERLARQERLARLYPPIITVREALAELAQHTPRWGRHRRILDALAEVVEEAGAGEHRLGVGGP